jgi:predicted alpha-1,2-mannosidase
MGSEREPVDCVNPFIDTGKERIRWVFTVFTARPFGMVRLGPNTDPVGTWNAGYRYGSSRIQCFSHIHSWQLAGLPVMPVPAVVRGADSYEALASRFHHDREEASPGFYAVRLSDHDVDAALTSTDRVGFHRYRFCSGSTGSLVFALGADLGPCVIAAAEVTQTGPDELSGFVENERTNRRSRRCRIYFVAQTSRPFDGVTAWDSRGVAAGASAAGSGVGIAPRFDLTDNREVLLKVAVSYVSVEGARRNLAAELPNWDFDGTREASRRVWNQWLSVIRVEGGTEAHRVKFYTDLWRTLVGGHLASDVDGSYTDLTGEKPVVRRVPTSELGKPRYSVINGQDGFWNSQWSLNLLYALAYPRLMSHYCNYLVDMYRNGGLVPRGPSGNSYTFVMIAAPTTPFLVSAFQKGIRSFDVEAAYHGMRRNAFPGGLMSKAGYEFETCKGGGIEYYIERGYIPDGRRVEGAIHVDGAAQTMEYAYQDWSLAQLAARLGREDDATLFRQRSRNYRNLFDGSTGFIRPRNLDGSWLEPFDPLALPGFCEANSWQYTWHVPQDLGGLARLMGGRNAFVKRLNEGFENAAAMDFYAPKPEMRRDEAWVNYGNEPGRFVAHLFAHAGEAWLTQKWSRQVRDRTFGRVDPYGFFEDDDNGKAAATSLLLSLGLFDVTGGVTEYPTYEITAPVFDSVRIALDPDYYPGGELRITVTGNPATEPYIQAAHWNGEPLSGPWLRHNRVVAGGELAIRVGPEPNRSWG